jgi:hypothetical protein
VKYKIKRGFYADLNKLLLAEMPQKVNIKKPFSNAKIG